MLGIKPELGPVHVELVFCPWAASLYFGVLLSSTGCPGSLRCGLPHMGYSSLTLEWARAAEGEESTLSILLVLVVFLPGKLSIWDSFRFREELQHRSVYLILCSQMCISQNQWSWWNPVDIGFISVPRVLLQMSFLCFRIHLRCLIP